FGLPDMVADLVGKEIGDGVDPPLRRAPGNVDGGIDPLHLHAALPEEAEQRAVIAAELDDERARRDGVTADHIVGVSREMLAQAERQRGGVDIVPVLDLRIADMENLEMPALPAELQFERD